MAEMRADMSQSNDVPDLGEIGQAVGRAVETDRRLFMQLLAYGGSSDSALLMNDMERAGVSGVLYEDINDPQGVAILTYSEDPGYFLDEIRHFLNRSCFARLVPKPEFTMLGRTYALGHERKAEEALLVRPVRKVTNPEMPWAIWYPLRRAGSFEQLSAQEQRVMLMEHGGVGRAFAKAGLGTDIRLACHGLDRSDNDFVIGLVGPQLFPLSSLVQRMRKTKQTSLHLEHLGPFFVGRAVLQCKKE